MGVGKTLTTDRNGFFADITLPPGRYGLEANAGDGTYLCGEVIVLLGEVSRINIHSGYTGLFHCWPHWAGMVDPNQTADLYRIQL